jgi:hypothetical protein
MILDEKYVRTSLMYNQEELFPGKKTQKPSDNVP